MKNKTDDTFELIKSLNKAEKGFFKKFAKGLDDKEDKNYIILFDILDKLDEYDENKIIKALEKKNKQQNLAVLKNYLYHQLLRFLRSYHSDLDINTQIRNSISDYEILKHHGLLSQARKVLDKVMEKADVSNTLGYAIITKLHDLDLVVIEHEMHRYVPLSSDIIHRLKTFTNLREIELLYVKIRELSYKKTPFRTTESIEQFKLIKEEMLLQKEENQLTIYALAMYYGCLFSLCIIEEDYTNAYLYQRKKYDIIHNKEIFKLQNFNYQATNHFFILSVLIDLNNSVALKEEMALFMNRSAESQSAIKIKEKFISEIHLNSYLKNNIFNINMNDIDKIKDNYLKLPDNDLAKSNVLSMVCVAYFNAKEFEKCQNLIENIIKNNYAEEDQKTQIMIRLLLPLIHFELKNYKLISYMAENHSRHLKNRKILYKSEACIFNFLDRIENYLLPDQLLKQLILHQKEINKIIEDPLEKNAFFRFDYPNWLAQKIATYTKKN